MRERGGGVGVRLNNTAKNENWILNVSLLLRDLLLLAVREPSSNFNFRVHVVGEEENETRIAQCKHRTQLKCSKFVEKHSERELDQWVWLLRYRLVHSLVYLLFEEISLSENISQWTSINKKKPVKVEFGFLCVLLLRKRFARDAWNILQFSHLFFLLSFISPFFT